MASSTNRAVAATALKQLGQPRVVPSKVFEKYATGQGSGASLWVRTPRAMSLFSAMYRVKSLVKLGIPRAGTLVKACFKLLNACLASPVPSRGVLSGPLVASHKGFAINPKFGIQILQNPAMPKKDLSYCLDVG